MRISRVPNCRVKVEFKPFSLRNAVKTGLYSGDLINAPFGCYLGHERLSGCVSVELVGVPLCENCVARADGFEIESYGLGEAEGTDEAPWTDGI